MAEIRQWLVVPYGCTIGAMTPLDELLGQSHSIALVREQAEQLLSRVQHAHRLPPILLQGETGTGKGLLARLLHRCGPRRDGPFVDVSCAAIPDALLEAELFGFERGAFTDARQAKAGLLHAAHKGTIFLDELALLPEAFQAKLLKAIEERTVRRLGSTRTETVDVQIIAASNEDLALAVRDRRFRDDLYHRLAVVTLTLPPLRERPEDVPLLAQHFLSRACAEYRLVPPRDFAPDARTALQQYSWPGNVRELSNVVERAVLLAGTPVITAQMLRLPSRRTTDADWSRFDDRLGHLEREQLLGALDDNNWNVSRAAVSLGISRSRLRYRIEKHGMRPNRDLLGRAPRYARPNELAAPSYPMTPPATAEREDTRLERRHIALLRAELIPNPAIAAPPRYSTLALSVIADKVRAFGGRVQELATTTIVGAFGVEPVDNVTTAAALAALAVQKAAERARRIDARAPAVKIAVHAAPLLVDRVKRIAQIRPEDEAAMNPAPDRAIQANSILVSPAAVAFLERRFELARQPCPGAEPLCRLIGPERTGFGLGGRSLTRFVGRERELGMVCDQFAEVEKTRGQIVAVIGGPGVGKSRFAYELTRTDRIQGWRVLSCRAVAYGASTPSLPLVELLKSYFGTEDRDDTEGMRQKVIDKLLALDSQFDVLSSPLLSLLEIPVADAQWQRLEPVQKRLRTIEACKRVILSVSQLQPLLLVFEDLHWVDHETQAFLDSLIEGLPAARALLLVSYRPEYEHRWGTKTYYTQLRIDPLAGESVEAMLHTLLGNHSSLRAVQRLLIERTEGNPLFLEESARALVETGVLQGKPGAYRLTAPPTDLEVPATVEAILAARIDRLAPDDKHLLQAAAAVGKDVPNSLLHAAVGRSDELLQQQIGRLQAAEFLYEKNLFPNVEYTFKHALTQEVAYGSMSEEQRKALHVTIVGSIERLYRDRLVEQVERLAHHALRGEVWDKALDYSRRAGEKAIARSANREAWSHVEQAIKVLSHLPRTKTTLEQAVDLRLAVRTCLSPLGEFARSLELGHEAVPLAQALDDPRREALVHGAVSISASHMGRHTEAIEHGERALTIAESLQEPALRIATRHARGLPAMFHGAFRAAIGCFQRDVGLDPEHIAKRLIEPWGAGVFQEAFSRVSYCLSQSNAALCFAQLGEFAQASLHAERAVEFAQKLDILYLRAIADASLGAVHLRRGDLEKARHVVQRWFQTYAGADLPVPQLAMARHVGEVLNLSGHIDDAIALHGEAAQFAESKGVYAFAPQVLALLGDAHGRAGRIEEARTIGERAVQLARQLGQRGDEAWALYIAGNLCRYSGCINANAARDSYQQALALAQELDMRPLEAQSRVALGELTKETGCRQDASEQFGIAIAMFRDMGMPSWQENAESALQAL